MKNLGPTPKAKLLGLNEELWITPSEYTELRAYMAERNQVSRFKEWHKSKLLVFVKKEEK